MAKLLPFVFPLILMTLVACSGPALADVVSPTLTPQQGPMQPSEPTEEPTDLPGLTPTEPPTMAPVSTATATPRPEPTVASTSTPDQTAMATPSAIPAPTATKMPTPTPEPVATATLMPTPSPMLATATSTATSMPTAASTQPAATWRGLTVAPEDRCSSYDSDDYPYSPSVEPRIVEAQGGIYGPYTGTWFGSLRETDIEHIVARSEAHDSGLCAADPATKAEFASDILNLTLASPSVNRHQKSANDVAEWLPDLNQCWYVNRTVEVRREYGLTIDQVEADAAARVLTGCASTTMVILEPEEPTAAATTTPSSDEDALKLYDDNKNGRITCAEAQAHGIAPVRRGHPAYQYVRDADNDGIVCE